MTFGAGTAVSGQRLRDTRDNFFTPTQGWYVDLSVPLFREALGSDRNFQTASLTAIGMVLTPKKLVDNSTACRAWLAANSARVGIVAKALA